LTLGYSVRIINVYQDKFRAAAIKETTVL